MTVKLRFAVVAVSITRTTSSITFPTTAAISWPPVLFNQTPYLNCQPGASPGSLAFGLPGPGEHHRTHVTSVDGYDLATQVCFQPLGPNAASSTLGGRSQSDGRSAESIHRGNSGGWAVLAQIQTLSGNTLELGYPYYPNFRTARSYQMNIGIQRQTRKRRLDRRLSAQHRSSFSVRH